MSLGKQFSIFGSAKIEMEETGQTGDFVGGIVGTLWSFAGMLLFYLSLKLQGEALEVQRSQWNQQRFEDTYFKMLEYYYKIEFGNKSLVRNHYITQFTYDISEKLRGFSALKDYKEICYNYFLPNNTDPTFTRLAESLAFMLKFIYESKNVEPMLLLKHLSYTLTDDEKAMLFYYLLGERIILESFSERYLKSGLIPQPTISFDVLHAVDPKIFPSSHLDGLDPIV